LVKKHPRETTYVLVACPGIVPRIKMANFVARQMAIMRSVAAHEMAPTLKELRLSAGQGQKNHTL
jgi:hypothetical protein